MDGLPRYQLLLVDDDEPVARSHARVLDGHGFDVEVVHDGAGAVARATEVGFDGFVVDMNMVPHDGLWTCRQLLALDREAVVIILSGISDVEVKVQAFQAGAMDYVVKNGDNRELAARIRAKIEDRRRALAKLRVTHGSLAADPGSQRVYCSGRRVDLRGHEATVFWLLFQAPNRTFTLQELSEACGTANPKSLQRVVQRVRTKLGVCGAMFTVVRGRGYVFIPPRD